MKVNPLKVKSESQSTKSETVKVNPFKVKSESQSAESKKVKVNPLKSVTIIIHHCHDINDDLTCTPLGICLDIWYTSRT